MILARLLLKYILLVATVFSKYISAHKIFKSPINISPLKATQRVLWCPGFIILADENVGLYKICHVGKIKNIFSATGPVKKKEASVVFYTNKQQVVLFVCFFKYI